MTATPGEGIMGDLRDLVRATLAASGISQASAASRLGLSQKHLSQMLTGRAVLTLPWAERLLDLCGWRLMVSVAPASPTGPATVKAVAGPPAPSRCPVLQPNVGLGRYGGV
ncbi:helix-turn-helix domain-containing protein [Streptomyces sp. NPDC092296]|uniref:helix-turn-helix domain-containing protein n=1 Tax=Streptomyces sp. NPDC092296 TaxID=3366012 RepID=UPI003819B97C